MIENSIIYVLIGALAGGLGGALIGIAAGIGTDLARQGQKRSWIFPSLYLSLVFGWISLLAAINAFASGQPFSLWLALFLIGAVLVYIAIRSIRSIRSIRRLKAMLRDAQNEKSGSIFPEQR
jgi:hypothetical protein